MPRSGPAEHRPLTPDYVWNSRLITRLVTGIMVGGKKSVAERIVYGALGRIAERSKSNPLEVFEGAVRNIMPTVEVRPRRVGGQTYQVPLEVRAERKLALGLRWLIQSARARGGHSMAEKLADELMDAAKNAGGAVKKKEDTHRMAEANRAFAHYRW